MDVQKLVRHNIRTLEPYSCARNEFKGEASVWLDANENPHNAPYNRYPDPLQEKVKMKIGRLKKVPAASVFLGNGSDEPIDLLFRAFCEPRIDNVVAIDPTYGMYRVAAAVNDIEYRSVQLNDDFTLSARRLLEATDVRTRLIFLCSPNNPTGNSLDRTEITRLITAFPGLVVLDEAYIDFSVQPSFLAGLDNFPNLVVLQTFSKAWGSAGVRLGMAFASPQIIDILNRIKYPYNVNGLTQDYIDRLLDKSSQIEEWVAGLIGERSRLAAALDTLPVIRRVWPSDANFLLVRVGDADTVYRNLTEQGIIVRNRSKISLCAGCLRITVGTREENDRLLEALTGIKE